jgi:hypothetical protein
LLKSGVNLVALIVDKTTKVQRVVTPSLNNVGQMIVAEGPIHITASVLHLTHVYQDAATPCLNLSLARVTMRSIRDIGTAPPGTGDVSGTKDLKRI